jgi:hypothetical protein
MNRLRPLIFLPASYPRVVRLTGSAPLTLWESMMPADGSASRRSLWRTRCRRVSSIRSVTRCFSQHTNYQYTVCQGGKWLTGVAAACSVVSCDAAAQALHVPRAADGKDSWVMAGLAACLLSGSRRSPTEPPAG